MPNGWDGMRKGSQGGNYTLGAQERRDNRVRGLVAIVL